MHALSTTTALPIPCPVRRKALAGTHVHTNREVSGPTVLSLTSKDIATEERGFFRRALSEAKTMSHSFQRAISKTIAMPGFLRRALPKVAAVAGAAAGAFLLGPPLAGLAGALGQTLGAASGIYAGSVLGGITGGSLGTYVGVNRMKLLGMAGLALGVGLAGAAAGGYAGAIAGANMGLYIGKALAYAGSSVFGMGTGWLIGKAFASGSPEHGTKKTEGAQS
jgi:hypothetical protein